MDYNKLNVSPNNLLNNPEKQDSHEGILGSFVLIGEKKLTNLRTDIEKERLKKEIEEARESEQYILEYLGIDNYLGINMPRTKARVNFHVTFPIQEEKIIRMPNFYNNVFYLYFLKHPEMDGEMFQKWLTEKKSIGIEFGVTQDKSSYFIRNIYIKEDASKKDGE